MSLDSVATSSIIEAIWEDLLNWFKAGSVKSTWKWQGCKIFIWKVFQHKKTELIQGQGPKSPMNRSSVEIREISRKLFWISSDLRQNNLCFCFCIECRGKRKICSNCFCRVRNYYTKPKHVRTFVQSGKGTNIFERLIHVICLGIFSCYFYYALVLNINKRLARRRLPRMFIMMCTALVT